MALSAQHVLLWLITVCHLQASKSSLRFQAQHRQTYGHRLPSVSYSRCQAGSSFHIGLDTENNYSIDGSADSLIMHTLQICLPNEAVTIFNLSNMGATSPEDFQRISGESMHCCTWKANRRGFIPPAKDWSYNCNKI